MCPSPSSARGPGELPKPGQHHFIRNEYWDEKTSSWVQMAGTRLPDNKANRRKLERDIEAMAAKGMRVRAVKYEVKEEVLGVIFGEGASNID